MPTQLDLASLLSPYVTGLTSRQLEQVSIYVDLLMKWNARMNLTAIRSPEEIVTRHFGESLFLARQPFVAEAVVTNGVSGPMIDVGSGAGFPGIPVKILYPQLTMTLVEAQQKKAVFLREVLRAIQLEADVQNLRAEELLNRGKSSAGLVTMRAVEKFEAILPTAAALVRPPTQGVRGGLLALLIGSAQAASAEALLPNWHFRPFLPLPGAFSRAILWGNQKGQQPSGTQQ